MTRIAMFLVLTWVSGCLPLSGSGSALDGGTRGRDAGAGAARLDGGPGDGELRDGGPDGRPSADAGTNAGGGSEGTPDEDGGPSPEAPPQVHYEVTRLFPEAAPPPERTHAACHLASPRFYEGPRGPEVLLSVGHELVGVDPTTGNYRWRFSLPAPAGELAFLVGTPRVLGDRLLAYYHTTAATTAARDVNTARLRHRVVMFDLVSLALDPDFPPLDLEGSVPVAGGAVDFVPGQALGRAEVVVGKGPNDTWGKAYLTFGNARDIQPWHGFAFEVDLDRWQGEGVAAARSGLFVTTPEQDCGVPGQSGSRRRICGGGLWAPSGPLLLPAEGGYRLILAAGNGQLDLARRDYANTLMKVGPGLQFQPECDASACADFDSDAPAPACSESCRNLFIPRMPAGEDFSALVASERCAGLGMYACWAELDYIGGSTPVFVELNESHRVLLSPAKDGSVSLVDADHLGTLWERRQLVPVCGTATAPCDMDWAGMIVTQPALFEVEGEAVAVIPTFMPDAEQPAGVFALGFALTQSGPRLVERWRWPAVDSPEATTRFRRHPSRAALMEVGGRPWVLLVEPRTSGDAPGRLVVLEGISGALLFDVPLVGRGYRFVEPLVVGDRVYVPTCHTNAGPSYLEGYQVVAMPADGGA